MYEYWFKHVESLHRIKRDANEQNHTVLEFREKLIATMKKFRNQGKIDELKKMSAKIKKTFQLQEKYLEFQKMLADKIKKGERVFEGPEYKSNVEHTKKIVEYMKVLKGKGIPEDVVKEKIADKMNEYWFKHVEETST
uniref:Uncharacterized protein n=2 Tax=Cacopsylla melanoneura TaxID=428564 RepID=A0A8D8WY30_9HEMI